MVPDYSWLTASGGRGLPGRPNADTPPNDTHAHAHANGHTCGHAHPNRDAHTNARGRARCPASHRRPAL